jgi:glucuronokinase
VCDFSAQAEARRAPALMIQPPSELVRAAALRFARELEPAAGASAVRWHSSIPRGVGLGGSSAIVIATLRALSALYRVKLERSALAELALAVETEELGIAAGPQDRVAQAYGGLMFMDFGAQAAAGGSRGRYEALPAELLPPLGIAWRSAAAEDSGFVHDDLARRFQRGEPAVLSSLAELAELAALARAAALARDVAELARCLDASFDARGRMLALDPRHVEMIAVARAADAGANYTGSGGAIVAACRDELHRRRVLDALRAIGCATLAPRVAP